ncbi:MAG: hypothetical protein HY820_12960 [Acidobacteria bacterium]|nr:hypothetical protein [Acidobacteriota bacterium]
MKLHILLLMIASTVQATSFTYNTTLTFNPALLTTSGGSSRYDLQLSGNPSFTMQVGDTLSGTISFANGPIHIQNTTGNSYVTMFFSPNPFTQFMSDSHSMSFAGLNVAPGTSTPATGTANGNGCCVGIQFFGSANPYDFTFTGINYSFTMTGLNPSSANLSFTQLNIFANSIGTVPEPASVALTGIGLLAIGFVAAQDTMIRILCDSHPRPACDVCRCAAHAACLSAYANAGALRSFIRARRSSPPSRSPPCGCHKDPARQCSKPPSPARRPFRRDAALDARGPAQRLA